MLFEHHHRFRLFQNKELDALYFMLGMIGLADALISVFVPLFLWQLGYELWQIVLFYVFLALFDVVFVLVLLPLFKGHSDKTLMLLSMPFLVLYYLGLGEIPDLPLLFFIVPAAYSLHMILFDLGFHITFTSTADQGRIGREVGVRYVVRTVAHFLGPISGGVLITIFGFQVAFFLAAAIVMIAVLPLFFFPKRSVSKHLDIKRLWAYLKHPQLRNYTYSGIGFAVERRINQVIWAVFLFLIIGNLEKFGIIVSAGLLLGAVFSYMVGYFSDHGNRRKFLSITSWGLALIWFLRPFFIWIPAVVGSHLSRSVLHEATLVLWSSQFYKISKKVQHTSLFILSRELLYNLSRIIFLSILALLAYLLPTLEFFGVSFAMAGLASLLFLTANKQMPTKKLTL